MLLMRKPISQIQEISLIEDLQDKRVKFIIDIGGHRNFIPENTANGFKLAVKAYQTPNKFRLVMEPSKTF